jgi:prolyl-tRNA editing enzyme YbaK/EbsC (Cys-tRNA(Pro) deacylase)
MQDESVARVSAALRAAGDEARIVVFAQGTSTAADAAAAIGCDVAQIAKSIVFRSEEGPVLVVASGANRVDKGKVASLLGLKLKSAGPEWVLEMTGFRAGGVSPVGHLTAPRVLLDRDLAQFDCVWASAGTPLHVFRTTAADLVTLTGGTLANVRQDGPPGEPSS